MQSAKAQPFRGTEPALRGAGSAVRATCKDSDKVARPLIEICGWVLRAQATIVCAIMASVAVVRPSSASAFW